MKLPDVTYIILFLNALQSAFPHWAERQRSIARSNDGKLTLEALFTDITDEAR